MTPIPDDGPWKGSMKLTDRQKTALISAVGAIICAFLTSMVSLFGSLEKFAGLWSVAGQIRFLTRVPPGSIVAYGGTLDESALDKAGWVPCDGRTLDQIGKYSDLYNAIGEYWGAGDKVHSFNVPDLQGVFLRGVNGQTRDAFSDPDTESRTFRHEGGKTGNKVGTFELDALQNHEHQLPELLGVEVGAVALNNNGLGNRTKQTGGIYTNEATIMDGPRVSSESRPKNASVYYIIKY
jgi:hypothetical protein